MATGFAELFRPGLNTPSFSGAEKLGEICFSTNKTRRNFRARENLVEFSGAGQKLGEFFPAREKLVEFLSRAGKLGGVFPAPLNSAIFPRPKQIPPSLSTPEKTRRVFPPPNCFQNLPPVSLLRWARRWGVSFR